jgi:hypothetical protein
MLFGNWAVGIFKSLFSGTIVPSLKKILPNPLTFWVGARPLSIGDTVAWNKGNYLVLDRRGSTFRYKYKLVNLEGINPWVLPSVPTNPQLLEKAGVFWYRGSKGRCYLRKTGHPRFELKLKSS